MTEAEFTDAIRYMRMPSKLTLELAHADLVQGIKQEEIAKRFDRTKGTVSQASKRVWSGFLKSKRYREVHLVLSDVHAFVAKKWDQQCRAVLNGVTEKGRSNPDQNPVSPKRPPRL